MLRFIIWIGSIVTPVGSGLWEEFRFLLDHPRRCFTLLFPQRATWWLFTVLVLLNGIDLIFFILLDLKNTTVTSLSPRFQFLDGLFQAAATRTAGLTAVNLADLQPGIQVSYLIMMYISVFPIAISVRQTNVYEEKSLGIYHSQLKPGEEEEQDDDPGPKSYLASHLRRQLSFDLWFVFLGLFLISVIEGDRISNNLEPGFTVWTVLFEIVSAYGTVGLSLGYPNTNASFSAQLRPLSKLVIISMMVRGRHRGLPYALDRAILLSGEGLKSDEIRRQSTRGREEGRLAAAALQEAEDGETGKKRGTPNVLRMFGALLTAGPAKTKRG
jgi:potassium uptake Trk family protein